MANFPDNRHAAIAAAYDFSAPRLIADIGGGNGAALRHILARFPTPRGLVFDREDVIAAVTPEDLMQGRIVAQGGSFFDQVLLGPRRTCSSAYYMIGRTRIACVFCAPAARRWGPTRCCSWARRFWSSIPLAADRPAI